MLTFRVLSALLSYPTPEIKAAAADAQSILRSEGLLGPTQIEEVCAFARWLNEQPQLEAEALYVETFDRGRSTSLYLFEHIHGESRDRGQAMVRLLMRYRMHGLDLEARELPDFLPLFLEFLSTCRPQDARRYLAEVADIIAAIGRRLRRRGAPYAAVVEAVASLAERQEAATPAAAPDEDGEVRDDTPAALDAAWEEAPVTFDDATLAGIPQPAAPAGPSRSAQEPLQP